MNIVLPEIIATGIYNTDIAVKGQTVTKKRKTTMFEIEIPIEKGGCSFINSESHKITTNTIICAKPGQVRHTSLPYKCYYIHIIVKEGILYDMLVDLPDFIKLTEPKNILSILKKISVYNEAKTNSSPVIVQSLILELIYKLHNISDLQKTKSSNYIAVEKAIKYINENLTSDLSLKAISEYVSFSPVYFHKIFKSSTSKTLREFIEEQRISKAINLLTTTNMTLTQIAYKCGFSSQTYFSYAFKRKMNTTPKLYAKKIVEKYNI